MDKLLQGSAMASVTGAVMMGLYGRSRQNFLSDFTYNKFHFGVYVQIITAIGLFKIRKLVRPH